MTNTEVEENKTIRMDNDYLFKSLFRSKEAREMVAMVLNKITGIDEEVFLNAQYMGGEIPKVNDKEKAKISDILIKIADDARIILEMNGAYYPDLYRKNSSYAFANYIEYTPIGSNPTSYPNIILVNIDVVKHFKTNKPISVFEIKNDEGEIEVDSYKSFHLILENARNKEYNEDEDLYQFAQFMNAKDLEALKKIASGNNQLEKAYRKVEEYMSDRDFLLYYDKEEMDKFEKEQMKKYGLEIGREEGLVEGHEKGLVEGHEKGLADGQRTIITNMINNGLSISEISKMTNISEQEIDDILN